MAASRRPSFLKRQKEQARLARATEKREAKRARKHAKTNAPQMLDSEMLESDLIQESDMPGGEDDLAAPGEEPEETPQ